MEHTIKENLHLDLNSFRDLLQASSEDLKIPVQLIEKDYYISAILRALSKSSYSEQIVFKGGTSLSKAYQLIDRFSEDVDFAVISGDMSGNQVKVLLSKLKKEVTDGLTEDKSFADISKGAHSSVKCNTPTNVGKILRKAFYSQVFCEVCCLENSLSL